MNKTELIKNVASKLDGCSQKDVSAVLDAFEEVIVETLKADSNESISVGKLGKFKVKAVPARDGVSAINSKPWHTDAHSEITFKMSKTAKNI